METERKDNLKICVYYLFILRNPFHIVSLRGMQRGIKLGQFSIENSFKCWLMSMHFPLAMFKHIALNFYSDAFYMLPESEAIALDYVST
jgi:hypothetical protein